LIPVRSKCIYSVNMADTLPEELTREADLRHGEYAWSISSFSAALVLAPTLGFACLGGQFQLRPDSDTIYELYWLEANSSERLPGESWKSYTERSCSEVSKQFTSLRGSVDFEKEALKVRSIDPLLFSRLEKMEPPVFCAYFISEKEFENLKHVGVRV
jgi:hypothetical protein